MRKIILFLACLIATTNAYAINSVEKVRTGEQKKGSRLVLQAKTNGTLNAKKVFMLSNPPRLVIDLPKSKFTANTARVKIDPKSVIKKIRHGVFNNSTHRVVVDLNQNAKYKYFKISKTGKTGDRLVVDLIPIGKRVYSKASTSKKTAVAATPKTNNGKTYAISKNDIKRESKSHYVIMIDPGHGGADPGAVAKISRRKSVYEKTITLSIAKKLQKEINKYPNMTAYLTRTNDTFVPLRTRIKRASKKKADIFISIHADSHDNKSVRGGSVYVLSEKSSDREAARLARIANRGDEVAGVILKNEARDIQSILIDLTQRESMNKSALLAQDILKYMKNVVYVKHRKAKFAGFVVLKSPDIPSILVEASYLSNARDRAMLVNPRKQTALAKSIARGLKDYIAKNY